MLRGGGRLLGNPNIVRAKRCSLLMRMARRRFGFLTGIAQAFSEALRTRQ
jgi:hypothetical protein